MRACHPLPQSPNCGAFHVEPFGNVDNGTPFETTVNILDPENGDCLQSLTYCEILLPHVSRGASLSEAPVPSIVRSNQYAKVQLFFRFFLWLLLLMT